MTTTSLKLPADVKKRAAAAARKRGISTHAFMVEAIDRAANAAVQRAAFVAQAKSARRSALRSGVGYEADQVHAYVKRRVAAGKAVRPKSRSWRG